MDSSQKRMKNTDGEKKTAEKQKGKQDLKTRLRQWRRLRKTKKKVF